MNMHVQSNDIHNEPKVGSINWQMDKQNVVYPYNDV